MPKRFIDGEALWGSLKLSQVPQWARAEYANLLPLALANGVFEAHTKKIWSRVYSFNRPEVTEKMVAAMLESFADAGMLFRWTAEGQPWGFWVGIEKDGRLPEKSHRDRYRCGPDPPAENLETYIRSHSGGGPTRIALDSIGLVRSANALLSASADVSESPLESRDEQDEPSNAPRDEPAGEPGTDQPEPRREAGPAPGRSAEPPPRPESKPSTPPAAVLLNIWQLHHGSLPGVRELSKERREKCLARLRSHERNSEKFIEEFLQAVIKAASTPFLCGHGSTGWRADFDWFVANDTNYLKVLEGKYDYNRTAGHASKNLQAAAEFLRRRRG